MKRILTVLYMGLLGQSVQMMAHEGDAGSSFHYSVYASYKDWGIANPAAVQATQQQAKKLFGGWNATTDKLTGMFVDMYGAAVPVAGTTNLQKAQQLMAGKLAAMGTSTGEWRLTRDEMTEKAAYVDFVQEFGGRTVVFSSLSFRFTTDGRLQRVKMKNHGAPLSDLAPALSAQQVLTGTAMMQDITGVTIEKKEIEGDWVWFPIPSANGYTLHPAWAFHATGYGAQEMPFDLHGYIDALTGELLYRYNTVNETFEVKVKANIHTATPVAPTTEVLVSDMWVTIGSTTNTTNDTGTTVFSSLSAPQSVTLPVRGPWARTYIGNNTPQFTATLSTSPAVYTLPVADTSTANFRAVSAFYHVNKIHDYMKGHWPAFTGMDGTPLRTNVDISGATCNAFYSNGNYSINFYAPQTSCRAFSMVSDIVYHEYGHGISYRFYSAKGASFQNGALGEGNSDVWAMCINGDAVVGDGAYWSGGNIRAYNGTPKVYPMDITGEVHADGEIIAGAWWDVAANTGSTDTMAKIFALTYNDLPNGASGTEGAIYHDILISALMNDDDDANLGNGTPHFTAIVEAFARHGIYLMADAVIEHKEIPHPAANTAVTISAKLTLTNPAFFDKIYLKYRNRYGTTGWDSVVMTNTTANEYTAQIPAFPFGTIVDYAFRAQDAIVASGYGLPKGYGTHPSSEVTLPYQYGVGLDYARYKIDFEDSVTDWTFGAAGDNATGGIWTQGTPIGTVSNGSQIQPGSDNTTSTGRCLVTGNGSQFGGVSDNDVDNGKTTVVTPLFDLPFNEPVIEYHRWFSNDKGSNVNARSDYWTAEITAKGSLFWLRVDYTKQSDQNWRRRIFRVSEFLPGANAIQMRFVAEDRVISTMSNNGQDVVEAAVDDFIIYESSPLGVDNTKVNINSEIYPNPADNSMNITVPAHSKGKIMLYDITGKIIAETAVNKNEMKYSINTAHIAAGTYMVMVQTQFAVQNSKVVISHK